MARPSAAAASRPAPQSQQQGKGSAAQLTEQQAASASSAAAAPSRGGAALDSAATGSALSAARAVAARIAQSRQGLTGRKLLVLCTPCGPAACCTCAKSKWGNVHRLQGSREGTDEEALQEALMEDARLQRAAEGKARRA